MGNLMLKDALALTEDSRVPFSIGFASFDKNRKNVGGELITIPSAIRVGASHNRKDNDTIVIKPNDRQAHPYTVHIHLITHINGHEVTL